MLPMKRLKSSQHPAHARGSKLSLNSNNGSGSASGSQPKRKRGKTKRSARSPLSPMECLPAEIHQMIFEFWPSPSLPQSSPILGRNLSSKSWLLKTCYNLWRSSGSEPYIVDDRICLRQDDATKNKSRLQNALLNSPWFDLQFTLRLEMLLADHHRLLVPKDQGGVLPARRFNSYWEQCELPPKILKGPWKTKGFSLFILLCPRLNLPLNLNRREIKDAADRGVWECIKSNNLPILIQLFQDTYTNMQRSGYIQIFGTEYTKPRLLSLADLQYLPTREILPPIRLKVTQDMLISAVIDHGCNRGIVGFLLLQGLYDPRQINYLDPVLWNWAEESHLEANKTDTEPSWNRRWSDGRWLKMMLSAVNKAAEHISAPTILNSITFVSNFESAIEQYKLHPANAVDRPSWWWTDADNNCYLAEAERNTRTTCDIIRAARERWGNDIRLYGADPHGILGPYCVAWKNDIFNRKSLDEWLIKPYIGQMYTESDVIELTILKMKEVWLYFEENSWVVRADDHGATGK